MTSLNMLRAFILGMAEFRHAFTTRLDDALTNAYDYGREWAHRITLRRFEQ